MHAKILHRFKEAGSDSEPRQQSKESVSGLEYEGSGASSEPTQVSLDPIPQSEVDRTSTGGGDNRREAPTQALASSFFSGATGTIVSGPAHFASTSGAQVAVHIHQPANFMNTGEQLNPAVLMFAPPPPLPVNTVNVIPSNASTPYANASTADINLPKDNEIYERLLRRKRRGFALYVPEPDRQLPIAYQRVGIRIGDVGVITPDGGFSFLFNICAPRDDPINPRILPEDFSPLHPDVDIMEFSRFKSGSYLASASIEKKESESNAKGLQFATSASEGAVLTMPEGAISFDLKNDLAFTDYLEANVQKWYEFVRGVCRRSVRNGQIRLVIGCDKTTAWGIATVSGMSQQTTSKLEFKTLDTESSSSTTYTWECSGMVEVRVGPDKHDIETLRSDDTGGHPLDTTLRNQCLFVRSMTATLSNNEWAKLMRNLGKTTIDNLNTLSGTLLDPPPGSGPSSSNTESSNQPGSHQGMPGTGGYAMGKENGIVISTLPDSSAPYHPSDDVNRQLLLKFPDCRMVITKDQDWLSTLTEDDEMVSDPEQLLEQILASHDVRIENGVLHLDRKKLETPRSISPSFISDRVWEEQDQDMSDDRLDDFISGTNYQPLDVIGEGAYGIVCSAVHIPTGRKVAIKRISPFEHSTFCLRTLREIKLIRHFHHQNIIAILDILKSPTLADFKEVYLVQELMETDLHRVIRTQDLSDDHCQYLIYQTLRALKALHSADILHRDLKPSNLLLNSNCDLKICGFGLARSARPPPDADDTAFEYPETRWYRAPEVMLTFREYTRAIDIWSVGCVLAEMLSGRPLFPGLDYHHQLSLILETLGTPSIDDFYAINSQRSREYLRALPFRRKKNFAQMFPNANPLAIDLMEKCLAFSPKKRLDVSEALRHPYLSRYHDLEDEPTAAPLDPSFFDFDLGEPLTKEELKVRIYEEITRPENDDRAPLLLSKYA